MMKLKEKEKMLVELLVNISTSISDTYNKIAALKIKEKEGQLIEEMLEEENKRLDLILSFEEEYYNELLNTSKTLDAYIEYLINNYNINKNISDIDIALYNNNLGIRRIINKLNRINSMDKENLFDTSYKIEESIKNDIYGVYEQFSKAEEAIIINNIIKENIMCNQLELEYNKKFVKDIDQRITTNNYKEMIPFKYNYICLYSYLFDGVVDLINIDKKDNEKEREFLGIDNKTYQEFCVPHLISQVNKSLDGLLDYNYQGVLKDIHLYNIELCKNLLIDDYKRELNLNIRIYEKTKENKDSYEKITNMFKKKEPVKIKLKSKKTINKMK